jgi:hypothetical protein
VSRFVQFRRCSTSSTEYNDKPWVLLSVKDFCFPSIFDSESFLSFVKRDVFDKIKELRLPHTAETTEDRCQIATGESCDVTQAVNLSVTTFVIFENCPVDCILGVDF